MRNREERLFLKLSKEEKEFLKSRADDRGLTLSVYCRNQMLKEAEMDNEKLEKEENMLVHLRLSRSTVEEIDRLARIANMTRARLISKAVLENVIIVDGLREFIKEINMMGSNLNQTVMLCNQGMMKTINFGEFNLLLKRIIDMLLKIKGGAGADHRKSSREKGERR